MQTTARHQQHLLECLAERRIPEGGLAFPKLWKINPDHTPASLLRISSLLRHLHQNALADYDTLLRSREGQNFLLTLAAYLADYVAKATGASFEWRENGEAQFGRWRFRPLELLKTRLSGDERALTPEVPVWQAFCFGSDADAGKMAAFALDCYDRFRTLPGGVAYADDLAATAIDGTESSLKNIDALIADIRARDDIDADNYSGLFQGTAHRNFLYLLAFYIGQCVCAAEGGTPEWLNRIQMAEIGGHNVSEQRFGDALALNHGGRLLPVLDMLERAFAEGDFRFADWAAENADAEVVEFDGLDQPNLLARRLIDLVMNDATHDGSRPTKPAYLEDLRAARPDYSLRSIIQLDKLLADIHAAQPDMDKFTALPENRSFLVYCACYLARTAAELSDNTLKFLSYRETRQRMPDLPPELYAVFSADIGGHIFFPMGQIVSQIFYPESPTGCADFVKQLQLSQRGRLFLRPAVADAVEAYIPDVWRATLLQAGFALGVALNEKRPPDNRVPVPATFSPRLLRPGYGSNWDQIEWPSDGADSTESEAEAVREGLRLLDANPEQAVCQMLVYQGYADLPRGRFDAIVADIRGYQGNRPLAVRAMLPFIPDEDGRFVVGSIAVDGECLRNANDAAAVADTLYKGLDDFGLPEHGRNKRWWRTLYRRYL